MYLFLRKRVLLDPTKGRLGIIFQTPPNMFSKKSLFRGKFGSKIVRNSRLGFFFSPGEEKLCLGYVLKTSDHTCVQHLYSSGPLGKSSKACQWYSLSIFSLILSYIAILILNNKIVFQNHLS